MATNNKVSVAKIERYDGEKVSLPQKMSYDSAIKLLERRRDYEGQVTHIQEIFDFNPNDGAHALWQVISEMYGFADLVPTPNFFGSEPPRMLTVKVGVNKKISVPWGRISLPGDIGYLQTTHTKVDGVVRFAVTGKCRRKDEPHLREILDKTSEYLAKHSIYQGKALAVRFFDDDGDLLEVPEPEFMDTDVAIGDLTFPLPTQVAITTNLFTPISRINDLKANRIPIKRGVLLGGPYGTGKTMTAKVASKLAVDQGITFLYCRRPAELAHVIKFAKQYAEPAVVVFCEDIDSVTQGGRDHRMNDILNIIDGVDTKSMNLITLLTTNHIEDISRAMLRPGRLDAIIEIPPPDPEAVERLIRIYGRDYVPENVNLSAVAKELDGAIPAIVAEVVRRAKLHQLALQSPGTKVKQLSADALLMSAKTMRGQRDLLGIHAGETRIGSAKLTVSTD